MMFSSNNMLDRTQMITKQIPYIFKPIQPNGDSSHLPIKYPKCAPGGEIQHRDVSVDGIVYSVPMNIGRRHPNRSHLVGSWVVRISGRPFFFYDDRYYRDPAKSLAAATDFALEYLTTDPEMIPDRPRHENITKNIEFGVAGISACWIHRTAANAYSLTIQFRTVRGYNRVGFAVTIKDTDLTEKLLETRFGQLVYMKHICENNPYMPDDVLRGIWRRIKDGTGSKSLPVPILEQTMTQIFDNLEMRKRMEEGVGFTHPITNKFVR